ncbi:L-selectin [Orchesella cincta]|uniref:L-selectin n=1 Tax=Orchesella cincta TaxID=48709 RepID=A0A1D2MAZ4_ORCCI|nr:L-selectin [Orchesella cincta]
MIYSSTRIILLLGVFASVCSKFRFVPDPDTCARRKIHDSFTDSRGVTHNYFFSWEDDRTNNLQVTWSEARNICRRHCMDLVSPETPRENSWLKRRIAKGYISRDGIWTSGRKCNFDSQCNSADFYPLLVNGWFWSAVAEKIKPTDNSLNGDWSDTGATGRPQPDNYEASKGEDEGCLAILNNFYNDGIKWHDAACHHKKYFVCEDSDDLLESVGANSSRNNRKKNPVNREVGTMEQLKR